MNKILCAATLALLSLSSVSAKSDFIKEAIEEGKLDVLKTLNNTDYSVNRSVQQSYAQLAKQMVEKRKNDTGKDSVLLSLDAAAVVVTALAVGAMGWDAYDQWVDTNGKSWKSSALFLVSLAKLADTAIKLYKDSNKEDEKAAKAIENAEKIAQAVNELPINENARIAANENPRFVRG